MIVVISHVTFTSYLMPVTKFEVIITQGNDRVKHKLKTESRSKFPKLNGDIMICFKLLCF